MPDEVTTKQTPTEDKGLSTIRDPEFTPLYASNVQFESTLWDLKMLFGEVDVAQTKINQHTSMAMSWPIAKIAAYYLAVNITIHQAEIAPIVIPTALLPQRPDPSDPNLDATRKRVVTYLAWIHDQFFSDAPYTPPEVSALEHP